MKLKEREGKIAVYITGEVEKPGVYYMNAGTRIVDLIDECGGLKKDACLDDVNLAQILEDSDKIDIPKISSDIEEADTTESSSGTSSGKVNINTASKEELKSLNGIGDTLAQNIIDYRNTTKFESIEDIQNVNGIGESKYESIKDYICVE